MLLRAPWCIHSSKITNAALCLGPGTGRAYEIDLSHGRAAMTLQLPAQHGGTLNSRRAASPLVRLVEGEERWETSDHPQSVLPLNWGGIEPNRTVTCMVLKATVENVKLGGHQTCLSINRLWYELCDMLRRLVGTTAPGHHDCSIQE
ncbi:uncharacterized protein TNCV_3576251 [Trichonephila clavipes]|nr:uncharacterized protein TNCV_3576251 [Trichonephila clavipes]